MPLNRQNPMCIGQVGTLKQKTPCNEAGSRSNLISIFRFSRQIGAADPLNGYSPLTGSRLPLNAVEARLANRAGLH